MTYTRTQLARVAPRRRGCGCGRRGCGRFWKAYLRLASALASGWATLMLAVQYFVILPLFALLAKRSARREPRASPRSRPATGRWTDSTDDHPRHLGALPRLGRRARRWTACPLPPCRRSGFAGARTTPPSRWPPSSGAWIAAGWSPSELDAVVFYEKPMLKFERILTTRAAGLPASGAAFPTP